MRLGVGGDSPQRIQSMFDTDLISAWHFPNASECAKARRTATGGLRTCTCDPCIRAEQSMPVRRGIRSNPPLPGYHVEPGSEFVPCWNLTTTQDGTVYTGRFENGRPMGEGTFAFQNGIMQTGRYEATNGEGDDEDQQPGLKWQGQSVVTC